MSVTMEIDSTKVVVNKQNVSSCDVSAERGEGDIMITFGVASKKTRKQMDLLTPEEIKKLKDMEKAMTPGPFAPGGEMSGTTMTVFAASPRSAICIAKCDSVSVYATKQQCEANAAGLAALRNAFPKLIAAHERCEKLEKAISTCSGSCHQAFRALSGTTP